MTNFLSESCTLLLCIYLRTLQFLFNRAFPFETVLHILYYITVLFISLYNCN